MAHSCRNRWLAPLVVAALAIFSGGRGETTWAQFPLGSDFDLSETVYLDQADSTARTRLEQIKVYLADGQWDEAIETLRSVMETQGSRVVELSDGHYVSLRDYCQIQLAGLPPEALELYRARVDPSAAKLYERGRKERSGDLLSSVIEGAFASSWGDDALFVLGEMALEEGNLGDARDYWQRLLSDADVLPTDVPRPPRLVYPDTDLPKSEIRARLVLVSILEGSRDRAEAEFAEFARDFPDSAGRIGGRQGNLVGLLSSQLKASRAWPEPALADGWPTFGGSPLRTRRSSPLIDLREEAPLWQVELPPSSMPSDRRGVFRRSRPPAEDRHLPLSYHPVLWNNVVLVSSRTPKEGQDEIRAFDLETGKPAWGPEDPVIFSNQVNVRSLRTSRYQLGVARFTMTVHENKLFARLGNPVTSDVSDFSAQNGQGSYLVCLDLQSEGKVLWRAVCEDKWAFEGSPVSDGRNVYVAMRRSDVRPQAHIACLDADTGHEKWRQLICGAETPGHGRRSEQTCNLLTLHHETLYCNTNLGAVAAVSTRDGHVKWITLYERARGGDLNRQAAHFYRDCNPCIYDRGIILTAPSDSPKIFAFDAGTGAKLWDSPHAEDTVHLLGTGGGNLLASGDRLWWINVQSGKVIRRWPESPNGDKGYGRGVLAGDNVYWPTRKQIHVFDQQTAERVGVIDLARQDPRVTGGNLLISDGYLLVTTGERLFAFSQFSRLGNRDEQEFTQQSETKNQPATAHVAAGGSSFESSPRFRPVDQIGRLETVSNHE